MKIKTSKISLINSDKIDGKLLKLESYADFQNLEILDEPEFKKFKISVPIFIRGETVSFRIPCVITVKKKARVTEIEIYSDFLKPTIVSLIVGIVLAISSYIVSPSLGLALFMFVYTVLILIILLFYPIIKQTRSRIKQWIKS